MTEWIELTAAEFCSSVRDGTHDSPKQSTIGKRLITSRHLNGHRLEVENAYLISQQDFDEINKRSKVDQWDVLISMIGTVGEVYLEKGEPDYAIKNMGLFKSKDEESGRWLYYYLQSPQSQAELFARCRGTTQKYIPLGELRKFPIKFPIDQFARESTINLLSVLDDKIELNRRMNETLEAMARAVFRDWFVDFGPTRRKAAGTTDPAAIIGGLLPNLTQAPPLAALFPDSFGENGLPEGWEEREVSSFAKLKGGKQLPKTEFVEEGDIPVFGGAGHMGNTDKANASGYVISVGRVGAYCGNFVAHRGRAWINNNASFFELKAKTKPEWFFYALRELDLTRIRKGAAQPFVSNSDIAKLSLVFPGDAVLEKFQGMLLPLIKLIEANEQENQTLAATRDILLPKLMSGDLRLTGAEGDA